MTELEYQQTYKQACEFVELLRRLRSAERQLIMQMVDELLAQKRGDGDDDRV